MSETPPIESAHWVRHPIQTAAELAAIDDPAERRTRRVSIREEASIYRFHCRRFQSGARIADAAAKFGGGSLLTATLLLIIGGQAGPAVIVTAAATLLLFVAATILWAYCDRRAAEWEYLAEWLEAVLKETEL